MSDTREVLVQQITEAVYDALLEIGANPGRSNKLGMGAAIKNAVDRTLAASPVRDPYAEAAQDPAFRAESAALNPAPVRDPAPPKLDEEQAEADAYDLFWKALDAEAKAWNVDRNAVIAIAAALTEPFKRLWGVRGAGVPEVDADLRAAPLVDLADEYISGAHPDSTVAQRPAVLRDFVKWVLARGAGVVPPEDEPIRGLGAASGDLTP